MKLFLGAFVLLIAFSSCQTPVPKFVSTHDTVIAAYRRYKKGPTMLYVGTYTTYQKKEYTDSPSVKVSYVTGYDWRVKLGDTLKDAKGNPVYDSVTHHFIANWSPVPDSLAIYLQIITIGQ